MPNWCITNITIKHENVNTFEKLLDDWTAKNYCENEFGLSWLGNILGNSGVDFMDEETEKFSVRCRGRICEYYVDGSELLITTETAWDPMLKMWYKIIDHYLPGAELIYTAEEPGMGVYQTSDPALEDCYLIDPLDDLGDIEYNSEATKETVVETLQHLLTSEETDIDKLLEAFVNSDYKEKLIIHKWNYKEYEDGDTE